METSISSLYRQLSMLEQVLEGANLMKYDYAKVSQELDEDGGILAMADDIGELYDILPRIVARLEVYLGLSVGINQKGD